MYKVEDIVKGARRNSFSTELLSRAIIEIQNSYTNVVEKSSNWQKAVSLFRADIFSEIRDRVLGSIPEKQEKLAVLLSGGEDSSLLTDIVCSYRPNIEIRAYAAVTKGNQDDILRASSLCQNLNIRMEIVKPNKCELNKKVNEFMRRFDRLPNDPAQPIHNYLCDIISKDFPGASILDGQFCDTILHSNPHNALLQYYERIRPFRMVARIGKSLIPEDSDKRILRRLYTGLDFLGAESIEEFILKCCRCTEGDSEIALVKDLTARFSSQTSLSAIFFWVTANYRERDKYALLDLPVIMPFDSEELFWLCGESTDLLLEKRLRKAPIHKYLKGRYPNLFSSQKTLPFEPF